MAMTASDLFTWQGTVSRGPYMVLGAGFFAIKHAIDRIVASSAFGVDWGIFNYLILPGDSGIASSSLGLLKFYATLLAFAIPFIFLGVNLTVRRLRDIGWPLWLVVLFFAPFINLLFFLVLSVAPSRSNVSHSKNRLVATLDRVIPKSGFGSAFAGVCFTSLATIGFSVLSIFGLQNYGWGLFVGLPFFLGLNSVLIYGYQERRSLGNCLGVATFSILVVSFALIGFAMEGIICILMAAPLGIIVALLGGTVGFIIQSRPRLIKEGETTLPVLAVLILAIPALISAESATRPEPALRMVESAVEIAAPPEKVWNEVVAFAEIAPPEELIFKTGIAYPIRAEITGHGPGAIRRCVFSTGAFVEPIEVWNEPELLQFGVTEWPASLDEMSPYGTLRPPHVDSHLRSRKGQFQLIRLENGGTRLIGTTWYENSFWPATYWGIWSDEIIHRIHRRVLDHIKVRAEV